MKKYIKTRKIMKKHENHEKSVKNDEIMKKHKNLLKNMKIIKKI